MHTNAGSAAGARCARVSALASRLPSRSRARASGDRSERRAAVLALRSAGARIFSARLYRRLRPDWDRPVQQLTIRCSSGRRTAVQGINRRPLFNSNPAPPGLASEPRRRPWRWALSMRCSRPWKATRTGSAHTRFGGFDLQHRRLPRRTRCSSCFTAMSTGCGRNGSARTAASIRRSSLRSPTAAIPIGHNLPDTMWPWNGITGGTTSADGAGRHDGSVAFRRRAGAVSRACETCWTTRRRSTRVARMGFDYDDVQF